jgi:hypothetical protein
MLKNKRFLGEIVKLNITASYLMIELPQGKF